METKVVKIDAARADSEQINRAAQIVNAGGLVAFPTETVYGIACRVRADSLARLNAIKGRDPDKHYTLHIGDKRDVARYVPTLGLRAAKLVERAWPGPLTIVFELDWKDLARQEQALDEEVFKGLYRDGSLGIRCPDNPVALALLREVSNPVIAPSANAAGQPPAVEAGEILSRFAGLVDMVLDAGRCRYEKSSTVVRLGKGRMSILREGVYTAGELEELSRVQVLFVCTGNSCRSPMAEGIFRKYLAEKLGCEVDRLGPMGYKVLSAGTMEMAGLAASAGALAACAAKGVDIRAHTSRALTRELIEGSDLVFTMEQTHQRRVLALSPEAANRCHLLADGDDIADPMGQSQEMYNRCADLIETAVRKRISELAI